MEFDGRPPFALRRRVEIVTQDGDRTEQTVERRGDALHMVTRAGGEDHAIDLPIGRYGLSDDLATSLWLLRGPSRGDSVEFVSLDLDEGELQRQTATVAEVETQSVEGVETRAYRLIGHDERRGQVSTSVMDARGTLLSHMSASMTGFRLESEEVAKRLDAPSDLFFDTLAKVDDPLGDTEALTRVRLRVEGAARFEVPSGPGQRVERDRDSLVLVLESPVLAPVLATPEEVQRALKATPKFPADHPEVVRLAREAVGDATTPSAKVGLLVHFVAAFVEDVLDADAETVLEIVGAKKGDCTEHAMLFTALARAAGVPTRTVRGLGYLGDEVRAFGGPAWNEVVLDGAWIPVDPTWDQPRADLGHIRLGYDGGPDVSDRVYGKLRFVLFAAEVAATPGSPGGVGGVVVEASGLRRMGMIRP